MCLKNISDCMRSCEVIMIRLIPLTPLLPCHFTIPLKTSFDLRLLRHHSPCWSSSLQQCRDLTCNIIGCMDNYYYCLMSLLLDYRAYTVCTTKGYSLLGSTRKRFFTSGGIRNFSISIRNSAAFFIIIQHEISRTSE